MAVGKWKNGKKTISGSWLYLGSDRFAVSLNSFDRITGRNRELVIYGDSPEWGNWKLERLSPTPHPTDEPVGE